MARLAYQFAVRWRWAPVTSTQAALNRHEKIQAQRQMQSKTKIPFRVLKRDHLIIIRGLVNEAGPFNFILDTGASMTVVTPAVARAAGILNEGRKAKAIGAKGSLEAKIVRLKSLRLGSVETKAIYAAIVNLATLSEPIKLDLGGIIGYNLLRRYRITIDYRTRTVSLEN